MHNPLNFGPLCRLYCMNMWVLDYVNNQEKYYRFSEKHYQAVLAQTVRNIEITAWQFRFNDRIGIETVPVYPIFFKLPSRPQYYLNNFLWCLGRLDFINLRAILVNFLILNTLLIWLNFTKAAAAADLIFGYFFMKNIIKYYKNRFKVWKAINWLNDLIEAYSYECNRERLERKYLNSTIARPIPPSSPIWSIGELPKDLTFEAQSNRIPMNYKLIRMNNTNTDNNNTLDLIDKNGAGVEQNATTTNEIDAPHIVGKIKRPLSTPKDINSVNSGVVQDIKMFLAKPYNFYSGSLSTTDTATTFPSYQLLNQMLTQMYLNKLDGFLGFRATTVIKFMVNANKFQQGRYLLCWLPSCGASPSVNSATSYYNMHRYTIVQLTQLPHVELDLSCDTQVELEIPFVSTEPMYPIHSAGTYAGSLGWTFIAPYAALVSPTGTTTASCSLWVYFKDVEVFGPTVPQSQYRTSLQESETRGVVEKPISGPLRQIAEASSRLIGIPLISEVAAMSAWAFNLASGVASAFGYSKPINTEHYSRIVRYMLPSLTHVDGIDNSVSLSLSSTNCVEPLPGFAGTDNDELSILSFIKHPSYFYASVWSDTQTSGTTLGSFSVTPNTFVNTTDSGVVLTSFTPLGYVAQLFNLWRGSISYRFKFVKTSFHSGRLLVAFIPIDQRYSNPTISMQLTEYTHRLIIDLREGNEFTITVPFMHVKPYCATQNNISIGDIYVYILDPLTRPSSVSSSVSMLVETWGGDDFEFAMPITPPSKPVVPTAPQSSYRPECSLINEIIGGSSVIPSDLYARSCVGEKIVSLRSLLKKPSWVYFLSATTPSTLTINPFMMTNGVNSAGTVVQDIVNCDVYSYIASCFAISRGSMRLKLRPVVNTQSTTSGGVTSEVSNTCSVWLSPVIYNTTTYTQFIDTATVPTLSTADALSVQDVNLSGAIEVQCPQYGIFHSRSNQELVWNNYSSNFFSSHSPLYQVAYAGVASTMSIYRSVGDDFDMGLFLSVPPCSASVT